MDEVGETRPVWITLTNDEMVEDFRRYSGPFFLRDIPTETNSNPLRWSLPMSLVEVT